MYSDGVEWNRNERAEDLEEEQQEKDFRDNPKGSTSSQDWATLPNSRNNQRCLFPHHISTCAHRSFMVFSFWDH